MPMHPVSLRQRALLVALLGLAPACGSSVEPPSQDSSVEASVDAAPSPDAPATPDAMPPSDAPVSMPVTCSGAPEIAVPANLVTAGVPTSVTRYAVTRMRTGSNTLRPSCLANPAQDGGEHVARFTAPAAGHWRLTARGDGLRALSASRNCNAPRDACTGLSAFAGENLDPTLEVEIDARRDETFSVVLDGCPADRRTCEFSLVAERVGPLACSSSYQSNYPCAERERCSVVPGGEHFTCSPATPLTLGSGTLRVSRTGDDTLLVLSGALLRTGAPAFNGTATLWAVWLDERYEPISRMAYLDLARITENQFTYISTRIDVPANAAHARIIVAAPDTDMPTERDGTLLRLDALNDGAVGDPCAPLSPVQCGPTLRCDETDSRTRNRCVRTERFEITSLRAFRSDSPSTLRLTIEGTLLGAEVSQARVELVDSRGVVARRFDPVSVLDVRHDPLRATFHGWADVTGVEASALPEGARVRVTVIDTTSRESASVVAAIESPTRVGTGVACADPSVACEPGLACTIESAGYVCGPARTAQPCGASEALPRWAPASSGAHSVQGLELAPGGITSCMASRSIGRASLVFVAPTAGRYRFETEGVSVLEVKNNCAEPVCVQDPRAPSAEVDLRAGDEVPITVLSMESSPFALRVRVP